MVVKLHWMSRYFKKLFTSFTLRLNTLLTALLSLSHFTAIENALVYFLKDAPCHYCVTSRESTQGFFWEKNVFSLFEMGVHVAKTALALPAYTS